MIYGGGPGSGCNPEVGHCGRPAGPGSGKTTWDMQTPSKQFHSDNEGHYLPYRTAEVHDNLVKKYQNKPEQKNPKVTVLLGGQGSGKTSSTKNESAKLREPAVVDIDAIQADLPEFNSVAGTPAFQLLHKEADDVRTKILASALAHNNDIALEAVGHLNTPDKVDRIENAGYKVHVAYVHRPVDEATTLAKRRAQSTNPMEQRPLKQEEINIGHQQSRSALVRMMKQGREVSVYDGSGNWDRSPYKLIYHRGEDGKVDVKDEGAIERMADSEEPKIPKNLF